MSHSRAQAFSAGGVIGTLGGLIGLGGAEFRLQVLVEWTSGIATSAAEIVAAAGGIHADNAATHAAAGTNLLVISATYTAAPRDVHVELFSC